MMNVDNQPSIKNLYSNYEKLRPLITQQRFKQMETKVRLATLLDSKSEVNKMKVIELDTLVSINDKKELNKQKIRGKFRLCLREDLELRLKVSNFAEEPLSFYIHKN